MMEVAPVFRDRSVVARELLAVGENLGGLGLADELVVVAAL